MQNTRLQTRTFDPYRGRVFTIVPAGCSVGTMRPAFATMLSLFYFFPFRARNEECRILSVALALRRKENNLKPRCDRLVSVNSYLAHKSTCKNRSAFFVYATNRPPHLSRKPSPALTLHRSCPRAKAVTDFRRRKRNETDGHTPAVSFHVTPFGKKICEQHVRNCQTSAHISRFPPPTASPFCVCVCVVLP